MRLVPPAPQESQLARLQRIEEANRDYAMLWRALMVPLPALVFDRPDHLRRTAQAAVEDWLEARET